MPVVTDRRKRVSPPPSRLPSGTLAGANQGTLDQAYREFLDTQATMADMSASPL
ncbi:hypothetical protein [Accumulibacter sp.]|uniref:hypothetical protein n=1 Tax=Accumulibacter sp. TaxID=2053492 RepID=UPI0025E6C10F|nr:hypothetical protein [Accumulibacter sp.]MCM8612930.1 hypothetical protein [Accumulibacter sp.]MCM8636611.1 hypothetical protein [Accumulibacter sp.]MCM8639405.1 hypothetical protein [Accumulibacter sp.]